MFSEDGTPPLRSRPSAAAAVESRIFHLRRSFSPFKCLICKKAFFLQKRFQAHQKSHRGEMLYECDFPGCSLKFRHNNDLRIHKYKHTGEKPFRCPKEGCTERFADPNLNCSQHNELKLVRNGAESIWVDLENLDGSQREWLRKYKEKQTRGKKKKPRSNHLNEGEYYKQHNLPEKDLPEKTNNLQKTKKRILTLRTRDANKITLPARDIIDSKSKEASSRIADRSETPSAVPDFHNETLSSILERGMDVVFGASVLFQMKNKGNTLNLIDFAKK